MIRLIKAGWRNRKWVGISILFLAIVGLIAWQFQNIADAFIATRDLLVRSLAFSIIPPLLWAAVLALAIWKRPSLLQARLLNRWLAALLATPVVWGVLAFFTAESGVLAEYSYGGWIGQSIKGSSDALGALRLAVMTALILVIAFPIGSRIFSGWAFGKARVGARTTAPLVARLYRKLADARAGMAQRRAEKKAEKAEAAAEEQAAAEQVAASSNGYRVRRSRPVITVQEAPPPTITNRRRPGEQNAQDAQTARDIPLDDDDDFDIPVIEPEMPPRQARAAAPQSNGATAYEPERPPVRRSVSLEDWVLPPISLLAETPEEAREPGIDQEKTSGLIESTLMEYGIEVSVEQVKVGPVVTMFGLVPGWVRKSRQAKAAAEDDNKDRTRVRVDSIVAREKDLAMALAAPSLRLEAPIPGTSLVGIEVPNAKAASVTLRGVMETDAYKELLEKSKLALGLGLGSGGEVAVADMARMPHLLIAGSTGSGKSVCMNTVISCMIMQNSPWETRLLLIDPKRVELTPYNGIPHLITPVVVEPEVAVNCLKGMVQEMISRYKLLEEAGARNIASYNRDLPPEEKMPFIVVAVDELADLMMAAPHDIEHSIIRLAQLGRATGIHMIVATQRPSVNVVTGLIKANFPGRISFAVASQVDSRTILDSTGAEKLLGRGDMLFLPPDMPKPVRIQGAFLSDTEIEELVNHWKGIQGPLPPEISLESQEEDTGGGGQFDGGDHGDDLMQKAWEIATSHNRLSTSLLQRRLRIGYPRAARLMDLLEEEGVIGPGEPGKSRDVLVGRGGSGMGD